MRLTPYPGYEKHTAARFVTRMRLTPYPGYEKHIAARFVARVSDSAPGIFPVRLHGVHRLLHLPDIARRLRGRVILYNVVEEFIGVEVIYLGNRFFAVG